MTYWTGTKWKNYIQNHSGDKRCSEKPGEEEEEEYWFCHYRHLQCSTISLFVQYLPIVAMKPGESRYPSFAAVAHDSLRIRGVELYCRDDQTRVRMCPPAGELFPYVRMVSLAIGMSCRL